MTAINANELLNQVEWMPTDLKTQLIDKLAYRDPRTLT